MESNRAELLAVGTKETGRLDDTSSRPALLDTDGTEEEEEKRGWLCRDGQSEWRRRRTDRRGDDEGGVVAPVRSTSSWLHLARDRRVQSMYEWR